MGFASISHRIQGDGGDSRSPRVLTPNPIHSESSSGSHRRRPITGPAR